MIPFVAWAARAGAAAPPALPGARSFAQASAASLTKGPQAKANADAAKATEDAAKKTTTWKDRIKEWQQAANQAAITTYVFKGVVEAAWGRFIGKFTMAAGVIKSLADPVANLARLANPAAVHLFELAWSDALAVVGRAAVPLIDSFRRAMENVGDMYAKFEPIFTKFFTRVGEAIEMVFGAMAEAAERNAPVVDLMLTAMGRMAQVAGYVAAAMIKLGNAFFMPMRLAAMLAKALGFGDIAKGATSKGAAIRDVQIGNSAEDFAREAQRKAFMQAVASGRGGKPAVDPLTSMNTTLGLIKVGVDTIARFVTAWANTKGIDNDDIQVGGKAVDDVEGGFRDVGGIVSVLTDIATVFRSFRLGG